jgi:hypothetical protein
VLYVIVDHVYDVQAIYKYMHVHLVGLDGFDSDEYCVKLCS